MSKLAKTSLPPIAALLLVVAAWQACERMFDPPKYLLPSPLEVVSAILKDPGKLVRATWRTAIAAVAALAISIVAGTLTGLLFSQSALLRRSLYPYAIFLQTVPIIAVAPLIVLWLGYGTASIVTVAVIISLFPVITAATAGLTHLDPLLVDFFTLHHASRWQTLWKLRLPTAVPSIITGAKTSSGLAVIGAIVGEFFTGYGTNDYGLGFLIRVTADQSRTAELFAAVLASTALGVMIFAAVSSAGAVILNRWYDPAH
ncbi:MAG: ABC transporter permease [Planctomycetota bacterium]|nr:ABC transporter permease [Planctomycetaceae bacterium]MDQ3329566.1 ABC transporter permease [Planctomycetota bacterium]